MVFYDQASIRKLALHLVGNQSEEEPLSLSQELIKTDLMTAELLLRYFLSPFKSNEYFNFHHEIDFSMNEVYACAKRIFTDQTNFLDESVFLAKTLYDHSVNPKIKGGEFYIAYIEGCLVNGEVLDALGLFKSENKEPFLRVEHHNDQFEIESELGINIRKLDKGCLIFNTEEEKGYKVAVIDHANRSSETYWVDDFLHLRQREDDYFNTQNLLTMTKNFITEELPQQFEVNKADQADLLNRSVSFFRNNDQFELEAFTQEVIAQPEVIQQFNQYKSDYEEEREIQLADRFYISENAVQKQARVFKSVIKLDKNFHIYVHGNRNLIEQGTDENGRKFYRIFYKEEH